jgi:hypothetical protein
VLDPVGQADPRVHAVLPHRDARRREARIGEGADRHRDVLLVGPEVDGRTTARAEEERALLLVSEIRTNSVASPSIRTCSRGRRAACTANTLPVRCWQARQWQIETLTGSPSTSTES